VGSLLNATVRRETSESSNGMVSTAMGASVSHSSEQSEPTISSGEQEKGQEDKKELNEIESVERSTVGMDEKMMHPHGHKLHNDKAETKAETKAENKAETKAENKAETKAETKEQPKPLAIPTPKKPIQDMNLIEKLEYSKDLGN